VREYHAPGAGPAEVANAVVAVALDGSGASVVRDATLRTPYARQAVLNMRRRVRGRWLPS
jgi:hypothetical protein